MKKAQMEMIGLVVIVILITLGMLFLAQFALKEKPEKKIFTREGLAYSTLSALMLTKADVSEHCSESYIGNAYPGFGKELLDDCAANQDTKDVPDGFSQYRCQNKHSCVFLKERMGELLEKTLGQWGKKYLFRSVLIFPSGTSVQLITISSDSSGNDPCQDKDKDSNKIPLRAGMGLVETTLDICE